MKKNLSVFLFLLAASAANAQLITKKESAGINAIFAQASQSYKPGSYVIRNTSLLTMVDSVIIPDQDILIEQGIIRAIGKDLIQTGDAIEIDGFGKYVMPGLTDMHVHLFANHPMHNTWMMLLLLNGVTTVRDMNGEPQKLTERDRIRRNEIFGPYLYQGGPIITGATENYMVFADTPETGRDIVIRQKVEGYDFIKVHDKLNKATYEAIVAEALNQHLDVVGHVPDEITLSDALFFGQRTIEHLTGYIEWKNNMQVTLTVSPGYAQTTANSDVWNCPTLFNHQMNISREKVLLKLQDGQVKFIPSSLLARWKKPLTKVNKAYDELSSTNFNTLKEIVLTLYKADAKLIAGTDAGNLFFLVPGFSLHEELKVMNEIGIPVFDVLKMATKNAAIAMNKENEFGTIVKGARADFLVLNQDPLKSIDHLQDKHGVMVRGAWISKDELTRLETGIRTVFGH